MGNFWMKYFHDIYLGHRTRTMHPFFNTKLEEKSFLTNSNCCWLAMHLWIIHILLSSIFNSHESKSRVEEITRNQKFRYHPEGVAVVKFMLLCKKKVAVVRPVLFLFQFLQLWLKQALNRAHPLAFVFKPSPAVITLYHYLNQLLKLQSPNPRA